MADRLKVGIVGATGMVGQRFVSLLADHPWFQVTTVAASERSAGKPYAEAVGGRWAMPAPVPPAIAKLVVKNAAKVDEVAGGVDFVFCAVDMPKDEIRALEDRYAKAETPVVSNNSAHRWTPDVPMLLPEVNAGHLSVIDAQKRRLGTRRGFIVVKPNCSIQSYVPALHPLREFGIEKVFVCTYQAISGAGKTFKDWPEMVDNVIPFIGGEEEKSENEPLKVWGTVEAGAIVSAKGPVITSQCIRVPVSDGHLAAVSVGFGRKPTRDGSSSCGRASRAGRSSSACRARRSPSSRTSPRTTGRRPGSTATRARAWASRSGACARTGCWTGGSCASPTTRSAERRAARC